MVLRLKSSVAVWLLTPALTWAGLGFAGCGQKGPLTLPASAASAASAPAK